MRLCRVQTPSGAEIALYFDDHIVPLNRIADHCGIPVATSTKLLDFVPPHGVSSSAIQSLFDAYSHFGQTVRQKLSIPSDRAQLLVPVPDPKRIILLAGNYAAHIQEGGGIAVERAQTFPYFFWKPPTSTLTNPGDPIRIPKISPHHVDWEAELGVVIGKPCRHVAEAEALGHVAGYTVCNDVSDRKFRINPDRKQRERDTFFDWLHGKWHDTFLPCGPCLRTAASLHDPQSARIQLRVNGATMQDANTGQMIFPVAALISILSGLTTLEPGDLIVTGTPSGVGHARKPPVYLKSGDEVEVEIEGIGILRNPVQDEE